MSGYVVRHRSDAPTVPCPCGFSTRILTAADGGPCSVHVTKIRDSVRHHHADTTEVYYVLEGTGRMELNGEWFAVRPGSVIRIDAGTRGTRRWPATTRSRRRSVCRSPRGRSRGWRTG